MYQINYDKKWAVIYWVAGFGTGLIFLLGGIILKDPTLPLYAFSSAYLAAIGFSIHRNPYCIYGLTEIKVYGHFKMVRKVYRFDGPSDVKIHKNRLYINGKKLKLSAWMMDKQDWKRMIELYSPDESFLNELNEL